MSNGVARDRDDNRAAKYEGCQTSEVIGSPSSAVPCQQLANRALLDRIEPVIHSDYNLL
jgi:hypothetical protein